MLQTRYEKSFYFKIMLQATGELQLGEGGGKKNRCFTKNVFSSFHGLDFSITSAVILQKLGIT